VLCTDKTGTLTSAEITLARSLNPAGVENPRAARLGAIAADLGGDRGALDAALVAGAAPEIVRLIFGQRFLSAAAPLALLIFGAVALMMISVASAILIGAGKPGWSVALAALLVPLTFTGCLYLIPAFGLRGAALATTLSAAVGAIASMLVVKRLGGLLPSAPSLLRSFLLSTLVYTMAAWWHTPGILLLLKLPTICLLICLGYFVSGEFNTAEKCIIRSLLSLPPTADAGSGN